MWSLRSRDARLGVIARSIVAIVLLTLAACDSSRAVQGGASNHGAGGRVKLGLPF
jgi:hypothetical protein